MVTEITEEQQFYDIIHNKTGHNKEYVLVDFYATWCAPCMNFADTYIELSEKYQDIHFCKIQADKLKMISRKYKIQKLPTFIMFETGNDKETEFEYTGKDRKMLEDMINFVI